jgi:RNA polymerase sigma-70 factor (ECF subfamily)
MRRERQTSSIADVEPQPAFDRGEDREIHDAVAALPLERRAVVVLHFFLGFTLEESAEILDIPAGTAASRLSRALASLREALEAANHV